MKVFINPGHGSPDPGATGFGLNEADVALQVGKLVEQKLKVQKLDTKLLQTDALSTVPVQANSCSKQITGSGRLWQMAVKII